MKRAIIAVVLDCTVTTKNRSRDTCRRGGGIQHTDMKKSTRLEERTVRGKEREDCQVHRKQMTNCSGLLNISGLNSIIKRHIVG